MQKYNAVVIFTTGAPGTGKTYSRCARFLYDYWLKEEKGVHYSNFPVFVEKFESKYPDAAERIKTIPKEVLDSWATGDSGPWDYFHELDIKGAHIAIDEAHNFIKKNGKGVTENARKWEAWLGEIRHRGCTVEFLSQDPHKLNKVVEQHSGVRILLVNSEDRRIPFFGILLGDLYQLRAAFTGIYETVIWQSEERRINGKWKPSDMSRFSLEPNYFCLYDSHNTPQSGGTKGDGKQAEWEKRGRLGCVFWFLRRNWWRLGKVAVIVSVVLWFLLLGGIPYTIQAFNGWVKGRVENKKASKPEKTDVKILKPAEAASAGQPRPAGGELHRQNSTALPIAADEHVKISHKIAEMPAMRSETVQRAKYETAPTSQQQQAAVPRVTFVTKDGAALDDGLVITTGSVVGEWTLERVIWKERTCVFFKKVNEDEKTFLRVPVGGPVGVRMREEPKAEASTVSIGGPVSRPVQAIGGAVGVETEKPAGGGPKNGAPKR